MNKEEIKQFCKDKIREYEERNHLLSYEEGKLSAFRDILELIEKEG